jgi:hypothetical protein
MAAKVLTLNGSVHLRPGRRAKCVLDIHAFEANIPERVPFWMFGGRGFPYGGESWPDWSRWPHAGCTPTTRYCRPGTERADLAEQDLIPDSREAELSERARTPHAHVSRSVSEMSKR